MNALSINHKIRFGYAIALSIAILGTATGFRIGEAYQTQALAQKQNDLAELNLLNDLRSSVLQVENQSLKLAVFQPGTRLWKEQYQQLLKDGNTLEELWRSLETYIARPIYAKEQHREGIAQFVAQYSPVKATYLEEMRTIVQNRDLKVLSTAQIRQTQQRLNQFVQQPFSLEFHDSLVQLKKVAERSQQDLTATETRVHEAELIKGRIIISSILFSAAIAALLAIYTSRTISQPIQNLTHIAKKATQDSNFDLQVPVTTTDEVGTLATAFNQLIHRVKTLLEEQQAEANQKLIQSEKMSSLGRMVADVAHEINNPVNFIYGNLAPTRNYIQDLLGLIDSYLAKVPEATIQQQIKDIDLEFLREDLAKILQSNQVGADRIRQIVMGLKNFSRLDDDAVYPVDLHACIDSTLLILNNRIKKGIAIVKNYGTIPEVPGSSGSLYQVFMNILSNAMDALEEVNVSDPEIMISTLKVEPNHVLVKISDNGAGMSAETQARVFETFFTTKPIGVGTGLGLSISHQIITKKHGGSLECESELGQGTTFLITLPIER